MTVYLVGFACADTGGCIVAAFSTEEKAKKWLNRATRKQEKENINPFYRVKYEVIPVEVDKLE